MTTPAFFDGLRLQIVELRRLGPQQLEAFYRADAPTVEPVVEICRDDEQVGRFDELMTQAALGAGVLIAPGPNAREVWLRLLVNYGKAKRDSRLRDWDGTETRRDKAGNVVYHSEHKTTYVSDLLGLAADYVEHLKTKALAGEVAGSDSSVTPSKGRQSAAGTPRQKAKPDSSSQRRALVDAYIDEVWKTKGKKVTRTDIWKAARYKTRTEFERWERCDAKATGRADSNIRRVLTEKPHMK